MPEKSISFRGWAPLFGAERAKINEMLREAGASTRITQEVANTLQAKRGEIDNRFKDALYEDPKWKAKLRSHTPGSPEWVKELNSIAKQVRVTVTYVPRSDDHGALRVQIGKGLDQQF